MPLYTAHCSEIALKGRNRYLFEDKLIANIKNALGGEAGKAEKLEKRIFFESDADEGRVKEALVRVFGIEWFARVYGVGKSSEAIKKFILDHLSEKPPEIKNKKIKVETKRGDKKLPFTSMELSRDLGAAIVEKFGCKVQLERPDLTIYVEIMQRDRAFVHFEKIRGQGGLPSGISGKAVALLSGGIDSPVAAWTMMRRGAEVIFLHLHPFADSGEAEKSKITELVGVLAKWQGGGRLYFADYLEFYKKTLSIPPKYELVMFRKFIYLLAQKIAEKEGALAIVSGDSLGQVASQTMENISAINKELEIPVFRPLIGMNKNEIIRMAEEIGTYGISIKPYKDCCSLVAIENPETRARIEIVEGLAERMRIKEIVERTAEKVRILEIK